MKVYEEPETMWMWLYLLGGRQVMSGKQTVGKVVKELKAIEMFTQQPGYILKGHALMTKE